MAKIITITNNKGGVLKTTISVNISALLAQQGKKVLLVDIDHQSNIATTFGFNGDEHFDKTLAHVIMENYELDKVIQKNIIENLDIIPSSTYLFKAEAFIYENIADPVKKINILSKTFSKISKNYDYIIIDTTPGFNLLTQSACFIADIIIVPSQMESYSVKGIIWLNEMLANINKKINYIIPTLFDSRTNLHKDGLNSIKGMVEGTEIIVTETKITKSIASAKAINNSRMPVVISNPNTNTSKQFMQLVKELVL